MKVYVDELPKSCEECSIYKSYLGCCLTDFSRTTPRTQRHNKCPLQSLSDYTKQARREVCKEIKKQIKSEFVIFYTEEDRKAFNRILKKI